MIDSLAQIDWSRVEAAILNDDPSKILSFELEDVKVMLWAAAEKWLAADLKTLTDVALESGFNTDTLGRYRVRGFLDLIGVYTVGEYSGSRLIVDWKTSDGELDTAWQNRLIGSFQWKLYAHVEKAGYVAFRGVNRRGKCREVFIKVPTYALAQATRQFSLISEQIHTLANTATIWPMKMPGACGAFNSTCQFLSDCQTDSMPRFALKDEEIGLSYSGADRFLLCPEKFRRVAKCADEGNDSTRLGSAFHRGIEEVYRQSFGLVE